MLSLLRGDPNVLRVLLLAGSVLVWTLLVQARVELARDGRMCECAALDGAVGAISAGLLGGMLVWAGRRITAVGPEGAFLLGLELLLLGG